MKPDEAISHFGASVATFEKWLHYLLDRLCALHEIRHKVIHQEFHKGRDFASFNKINCYYYYLTEEHGLLS